MAADYKNLLLKREDIIPSLELFHPEGKVLNATEGANNLIRVEYQIKGGIPALLNIYNTKDGRVTLHPGVGKNQGLSEDLVKHIIQVCRIDKNYSDKPLRISNIKEEDLTTVIDFLVDGGALVEESRDIAHGKQIRVRGKYGDIVSINHYNTGTLVVNGRALQLKTEIIEILSQVLSLEEIVQTQLNSLDSQISSEEALNELRNLIPNCYDYLGDKVIAILSPCIVLNKIQVEVQDYTFFVFPAFRGLEGFIKRIFEEAGVIADANSFGTYFEKANIGYKLVDKYNTSFNLNTRRALSSLYEYLKQNRHGLFHVDGVVEMTRVIEERQEADEILIDIFSLMEKCYAQMIK